MSEMALGGGADPLLALLGGGGAAPAGPPPAPPEAPSNTGGSETDALKQLIGLGQNYLDMPTVTEVERDQMMGCLKVFQKLLADNEKQEDSVMGTDPGMRKALLRGSG